MLHVSPSMKHPSQPSFDMDSYSNLNFTPGFPASGGGYAQTAQSICHDSRVPSSLQGPASEYLQTASQRSYPVLGHGGHGSSQASQIPGTNLAQSVRPSMGSRFIRTPSVPSSHPYHQARLCHASDRQSIPHQGWSQQHFPTILAPVPASTSMTPCDAVIGNRVRCHDSRQLPPVAAKFTPAPAFGPAPQSNIVLPNADQIMPSFMASLTVPGQTFQSTYETPASPPCALADEADIEYAQYRYGNKRCFYQCRFDLSGSPCNKWIVGDRVRVLRHLRHHHHLQMGPAAPAFCRWDKCTHSRPMKQENLSRHVVMHLGVKWKCPHCRRLFSRDDAVHRHIERMASGVNVPDAEVVPGYEARATNESQSKGAPRAHRLDTA